MLYSCTLEVAGLRLVLDTAGTGLVTAPPAAHAKFMTSGDSGDLTARVRDGRLREANGWRPLCTSWQAWQLWHDVNGCQVFVAGQGSRFRRQITVDTGFRSGEVLVELERPENESVSLYPLADLDIVLFANWLANSGDLILHASGVQFEGRGYCFVGASGAGKSTIAAAFAGDSQVTVLGEDNLVLRRAHGRFWIYGTPWHLNPGLCSPRGAPLEKLFFLDRTIEPGMRDCPPLDGVTQLLQTAFVPYYRQDVAKIVDNLARLAQQVPFCTLSYRLGSDVLALVRDA